MKRLIPTEKEWFNYKDNKYCSWLFSFIASSATLYNGNLYYTKKQYMKDIQSIKKFTGLTTKKSIDKYISKLFDLGYIIREDNENYYILNHTDITYILIDKDLLYNICTTKSALTIQIFVYLMDRMKMKQNVYNDTIYTFTIKELETILGYSIQSQNARIEKAIKECLQSLKAEGYINYNLIYIETNKSIKGNYKIPNHILTFVCDTIPNQLQDVKKNDNQAKSINKPLIDTEKPFDF